MPAAAAMIKDFDLTKLPSLPHTHSTSRKTKRTTRSVTSPRTSIGQTCTRLSRPPSRTPRPCSVKRLRKLATCRCRPTVESRAAFSTDCEHGGWSRCGFRSRSAPSTTLTSTGPPSGCSARCRCRNGCTAEEYDKKALAFILNIRPNLAQGYSEADVTQYLVDLMPKELCVRAAGVSRPPCMPRADTSIACTSCGSAVAALWSQTQEGRAGTVRA